jgi:diguanylate cyclase (GGDEF)-like protein/PAS domain S-box-containing protein
MRVRNKLICFILLIILVPVVIINIAATSTIRSSCSDFLFSSIENSAKNQADDINFYCEKIVSQTKNFTLNENVRSFVEATLDDNYTADTGSSEYLDVQRDIKSLDLYGESLLEAVVINSKGLVIAADGENSNIGRRLSGYKEIFDAALKSNGFSGFSMSSINDSQSPIFSVSRLIYSDGGDKIGVFYAVYDTSFVQKYINDIKLDKYTSVAIMDGSGQMLEYPFKKVNSYSGSNNFSVFGDSFKALTSASSDKYVGVMTDDASGKNCFYAAYVSNAGWYIVTSTDKDGMTSFIRQTYIKFNALVVILAIAVCAAGVFFAIKFLEPLKNIVDVFREKQKGNASVRFDINTKDEFSEIGMGFNSMFDNIFESEQRYRTIVEMTNNITFEINYKKNTVFVSKNFNKKFSFRPKDDSLGESFIYKLRIHKDDKERYLSDMDRILGPSNFIQGEYRVKSIYGDFIWVMIKATKFYDRDEKPTKIIGVIVDIDREKKSNMHLIQRASYDNLTQLLNRETFIKSLGNRLEETAVKRSLDAMMFIDLDDFKHFNDEYGHACGDEVLKFVADTLKEISFERGFAGRFGGDEFVLCITNLTLYGDAGKAAQEILDILGAGFTSESTGLHLSIRCSIGIAFLHESGKNTEQVIAAADEAMYNIKKFGKSAYSYAKSAGGNAAETRQPSGDPPARSEGDSMDFLDPIS